MIRPSLVWEKIVKPVDPDADPLALKDILAHYPTGVTIVCSMTEERLPVGCTVSSFSPVSLEPPLVLFSLKLESPSLDVIQQHGGFSVNVLGKDHGSLARWFAQWQEDKFAGVDWFTGTRDCPILHDAVAYFECDLWRVYDGGDHRIIVGRVEDTGIQNTGDPLVIHRGKFRKMHGLHRPSEVCSRNGSG